MATTWIRLYEDFPSTEVWAVTLVTGETSDWLVLPAHDDKCLQVYGTFGGGLLICEGANHPTTPVATPLKDTLGNAISLAIADIVQLLANPYSLRCRIQGGSGASITCIVKGSL
jgi:hypothetical protein